MRVNVALVGAGPGDPGLLTVRARDVLRDADVVLTDRLVPPGILDGLAAEVVDVGKVGGGEQVPQDETTALLVEHARAGRRVVRLKGGDPFVFGRGGEEALALRAAGIPFEVVPGVTSGVAAAAYAGIPVTQRGMASAVALVTGHEDPAKGGRDGFALDWPALAAFPGTLCFYMGVRALPRIAERLQAGGRAADEPVAVVERGTLAGQRTVVTTLARLVEDAAAAGLRAPAMTIVGPVAALADELAWIQDARPLLGLRVAVTRARAQASALAVRLRGLGADVVEAPAIAIEPLPFALGDVPTEYDLICVTSPNGAQRLLETVRDARALAGPTIAAIGPGTARVLRAGGIEPDVVPERAIAESLVEALRSHDVRRALVVRAEEARDVLPDALRERGAQVDVVAAYRTLAAPLEPDALAGCDWATFTSASSVRAVLDAGASLDGVRCASIGPVTSDALREAGLEPTLEATEHTPDGLVEALIAAHASPNVRTDPL